MTHLKRLAAAAAATLCLLPTAMSFSQPASAQMLEPVKENHRTYLVNGLASIMPFVGYGFANLQQKLDNARHYSYATPVEGRVAIQPAVMADIRRQYARDPSVKINLVGISYGGNIVTSVAAQLHDEGIPVNYLAVLDGPVLTPVTPNVHRVDNFVCRTVGCIGQKVRLAPGNNVTLHTEFTYTTTHIALGDHARVHDRITGQLTAFPLYVAGPGLDPVTTASIAQ